MTSPIRGDASNKEAFITTAKGMGGFFAVMLWWNDEDHAPDGFWEPWDTGFGRYATEEEAIAEAKQWAAEEGLEYKNG